MTARQCKALVLPGAGARGAYQVGVLKAIAGMLPQRSRCPFAVLAGTSAGAINAAVLASRAGRFKLAVDEMERVWANFTTDQVFRVDTLAVLKSSIRWLFSMTVGASEGSPDSFLDCEPLRRLLAKQIRFDGIRQALEREEIRALAITASAYTSARTVTFFQAKQAPLPWARVRRIGRPVEITLEHVMASSAVPFVFPPVRIGAEYYGDGSMRQHTPLSPSIHLGADRLLVIGVRDEHPDPEPAAAIALSHPSFADVAGYMLDTLFMDGLYADLERLTRINSILEQLGDQRLAGPLANLRQIQTLIIVPSRDLREIAARHAQEMPRAVHVLLRRIGAMRSTESHQGAMQLVSYLLFESGFTRELIDLGYKDALEREDELRAFLFDDPIGTIDAPLFIPQR